ncbi:hypothetical protein VTL71DRAFT_7028 [Oculimacula yallundae]|uniref:NmrA-like domain-containing protein n=1 Tax=Oculimacula yallundae TaxID=86028 RepID=A0ABR4BX10_9HELO
MSATTRKTIAIIGATGNQGSSVARTFLSLPSWHVRCLTRSPTSPAALTLQSLGAEIIQADLSSPSSLTAAFKNLHAIFVNTDFWGQYTSDAEGTKNDSLKSYELEVQHGINAAKAAAEVDTLERFVYSALGPMKRASGGKYPHSWHWESKNAVVEFIESGEVALRGKASFVYLGAYATNAFLVPSLDGDGDVEGGGERYKFVMPMKREARMPIIDPAASTGAFVRALVEDEEPGVKLLAYDSYLTIGEIVELWEKVTGRKAMLESVSTEWMNREMGVPLEVLGGPAFIEEFGYMAGIERWVEPHQLKEKVETKSFEEFLRGRDWAEILGSAKAEMDGIKGS